MAQVQAYIFADSTALYSSGHTLTVTDAGGTLAAKLSTPTLLVDALATWQTLINTGGSPPTGTYTLAYSATTGRVTVSATGVASFTLTLPGRTARMLGYSSASYTGSLSYTGEAVPAGVCELLAVEIEPPEDAAQADLDTFRHGRAQVRLFGNHQLARVKLYVRSGKAPADLSYLTTGRVRVYATADVAPYSVTNLDGYFDGYVVDQPSLEFRDQDESLRAISLVLAVTR
tara:strand:+ start:84 stop:773 length:690 start_codon:yes stop_codon:yes gene_type:complete